MFKRREKPNTRKRDDFGDGDGESGAVPSTVAEERKTNSGSGSNEGGRIAASTRKGDASAATLLEIKTMETAISGYQANDSASARPSEDAVRVLETETEVSKDTRSKHERNQKIHEGLKSGELEAGLYRGLEGYKRYAERSEGAISASKYSGLLGPNRGMANVRSTMRVEYWAACSGTDGGICKDYKETGYCGFGDSCKYLHDRSDYKSGHIIEAEWEAKQKKIEDAKRKKWEKRVMKKAEGGAEEDGDSSDGEDSDDGDDLPAACQSCRSKWEECTSVPIQTVCGHYFCEDCAMANYARTPKCMTCDAPTNGIFNCCNALDEKIKQQKASKAAGKLKKQRRLDVPYGVSLED